MIEDKPGSAGGVRMGVLVGVNYLWDVPVFPFGTLHVVAYTHLALVGFVLWLDLDTRWGLSRIFPKGPSQNVIARHIPKARRGEKLKKIVIVAHYDSARASLAFSPGMVGQFPVTFALMKASTWAIPVVLSVPDEDLHRLAGQLAERFEVVWDPIVTVAPVLGAHTGPSIVGLAVGPADLFAELN